MNAAEISTLVAALAALLGAVAAWVRVRTAASAAAARHQELAARVAALEQQAHQASPPPAP